MTRRASPPLSLLAAPPHAEGHTREDPTGAGAQTLATPEGLCAAASERVARANAVERGALSDILDHNAGESPMDLRQAGPWFSVCAGVAAAAALVRWPYSLLAELFLAGATLLSAGFLIAWEIGLFFNRLSKPHYQSVTLIGAGALLGAYLAVAIAYFTGYIGYNYPASQQRIYEQAGQINWLSDNVRDLQKKLDTATSELSDAKKAMADPQSVAQPAYNLETSVKLQFDNTGAARAIDVHNVSWNLAPVPEAKQVGTVTVTPKQVEAQSAIDCGSLANMNDQRCAGRLFLGRTAQCPEMECPEVAKYETSTALIVVLEFPYPIHASGIKLEAHGAMLPEHKTLSLTNRSSIVVLDGQPRNLVLDITVEQKGT